MKKILPFIGLLFTSQLSCYAIAAPIFTGQSDADAILKADVQVLLIKLIPARHGSNCKRIDRIDTQTLTINRTAQGDLLEVIENWNVTACNITKPYRISFRPDAKGEIDFNIRLPPQ